LLLTGVFHEDVAENGEVAKLKAKIALPAVDGSTVAHREGRDRPYARDLTPRADAKASQSWTASVFRRNAVSNRERISKQWEFWKLAPDC
jgi:hypothetical protein